jgi:glycosyltransferase involved in cell wall biosynthesis
MWLIHALHVLRSRGVGFTCRFVGGSMPSGDSTEHEIRAEIERYGLSDAITLTGRLDDDRTKAEVDGATVLVHPSSSEGFGMVLVEALARCRCPVASDIPGCRDALNSGEHGILVELNDIDGLADGIVRAHENTRRAEHKIRNARRYAEDHFNCDAFAHRIASIYYGVERSLTRNDR